MTQKHTFVSVIMPAYNAEKTIEKSIESVLNQTHKELELIIVDDGSTDRTPEIARAFEEKDARVRFLINDVNSGVSLTRNHGVREAKHDWIAFLDSDDTWREDKLEKQLALTKEHPDCALFFTASAFVFENGERSSYVMHAPKRVCRRDILCQNVISCSSTLIKKDVLLRHPMKNDRMIHEDFAAWLSILAETPYAAGVDEPLLIYLVSKHGKSGNKFRAAKMQWRTYRAAAVPLHTAIPSFCVYALRSLRKYAAL